ncbi:MAG: hypothetical protein COB14_00350 [Alphaproteobacteria bacterium]|nr:MAG: hypothetical protein COB14_00350 [Alphaproteobacteria bacterium]
MTTLLPQDQNDNPIPALRMKSGGAHNIIVGASSTRNTTSFNAQTRVISLYTDAPVYIAFGDSSITATTDDHFFPAGIYYDVAIGGDHSAHYTHAATLQVSSGGTLYISEKE